MLIYFLSHEWAGVDPKEVYYYDARTSTTSVSTPRKTISMLPEHRRQDLKYNKVLFKQISEVTYSIDSVKRETSFIWENIQNLKSIIPDTLSCFFSFYIVL